MATKPRGGGAKGLSGQATKNRTFFAASLTKVLLVATGFPSRIFNWNCTKALHVPDILVLRLRNV